MEDGSENAFENTNIVFISEKEQPNLDDTLPGSPPTMASFEPVKKILRGVPHWAGMSRVHHALL